MNERIVRMVSALLTGGLLAAAVLPVGPVVAEASSVGRASATTYESGLATVREPGGLGWYSSNWAGYALSRGSYHSVTGQWTVPAVSAAAGTGFSALWIGVDGFSNSSLIQTGTEADVYGGRTHYAAWWEILPLPAVTIRGLAVRPGDRITASIARVGSGRWRITIRDSRSGSYSTTRSFGGPGASAEWIEEAPIVLGHSTPLAAHGRVVFDNVKADGVDPHLRASEGGAMIRRGMIVDIPSVPDADGNGFALVEQGTPPSRPDS
jgi:Peptidase A4 family